MVVAHKSWNGLQLVRKSNHIAQIQTGSCAPLGSNPATHSTRPDQAVCLMSVPAGTYLVADIRLPATDANDDLITNRGGAWSDGALSGTALNVGGVLNGLNADGTIDDGFYYAFIGTTDNPDANGMVPRDSVHMWISKYFISGGVAPGSNPKPKNIKQYRPHPGVFMVQNNIIAPMMALGEGHTVTNRYQFTEFRDYKSGRTGGVQFNPNGTKFYVHEDAVVLQPDVIVGNADGTPVEEWISFFDVVPQTHKAMDVQIEYEGTGEVFCSVSANIGQRVAYANGGKGVARFWSNTGSDAAGRGIKITLIGDVKLQQVYMLASTSQQPM